MIKALLERIRQGHQTLSFPKEAAPALPRRFRGRLNVASEKCDPSCSRCLECCPVNAISKEPSLRVDLGRCLFCGKCVASCPNKALLFTKDYRLAVSQREKLIVTDEEMKLANEMGLKIKKIFGRSLALRQVSAGGCNGCEPDVNVLTTIAWDLSRFGIQFVASPRHADGLLITGSLTQNMKSALIKTYEAIASPKIVIAVGACAISGGLYADHPECQKGTATLLPVDLFIPGCPPHPLTILDGLLRFLGRSEDQKRLSQALID